MIVLGLASDTDDRPARQAEDRYRGRQVFEKGNIISRLQRARGQSRESQYRIRNICMDGCGHVLLVGTSIQVTDLNFSGSERMPQIASRDLSIVLASEGSPG